MTTIEHLQRAIAQLIRTVHRDIDRRGILMLDRARLLLGAVRHARMQAALSEKTTPANFFNAQWRPQLRLLQRTETRLRRIIRGTAIPTDDHERSVDGQQPDRT